MVQQIQATEQPLSCHLSLSCPMSCYWAAGAAALVSAQHVVPAEHQQLSPVVPGGCSPLIPPRSSP